MRTLYRLLWWAALALPAFAEPKTFEGILADAGDRVAPLLDKPEFEIQIRYVQVDRDARGRPSFRVFSFGIDPDRYFYPASTVKFPAALVALEKLGSRKLHGVDRETAMLTGVAHDWQTGVDKDRSSASGLPTLGNYIRKIFLVSDNDAFNRVYEFVGPDMLEKSLRGKGFTGTRIFHRLAVRRQPWHGRYTNPIRFEGSDGQVIYDQAAAVSRVDRAAKKPILKGRAYLNGGGKLHREPKDFAGNNFLPLAEQQDMLVALVFPKGVPRKNRWRISEADRRFVLRAMGQAPARSKFPDYSDKKYHAGYVKFLLHGGQPPPRNGSDVLLFNKVGQSYGYLIDNAYIVDPQNGVEFFLAAVIHTNANQTYNDGRYEYDKTGFPFMRDLGRRIYQHELRRQKAHRPDLGEFAEMVK